MSSSTPVSSKKTKKTTKPDVKGKKKASSAEQAKNEGVDPNWKYTPPSGAVLVDCKDEDAKEFDWDAINNDDDVEIWLIRIPDSVKPKHLENMSIDPSSLSSSSSCVGTLERKLATFDLWTLGDSENNAPVGGEEIKSIACLLPRKSKKGKLYQAPKPIAKHLVLAARPVKPSQQAHTEVQHKSAPRQVYPTELLKHRFMPYGSLVHGAIASPHIGLEETIVMDVDPAPTVEGEAVVSKPPPSLKKGKEKGKGDADVTRTNTSMDNIIETKKGKKRKSDSADATVRARKSKKAKVTP